MQAVKNCKQVLMIVKLIKRVDIHLNKTIGVKQILSKPKQQHNTFKFYTLTPKWYFISQNKHIYRQKNYI